MVRIITEAFKNLPSWIKPYMNKDVTRMLNSEGIDLQNLTYEPAPDLRTRDPRWNAEDNLLVALIDTGYGRPEFYGWSSTHGTLNDPYCSDSKRVSQHSKSWLIDHATEIGFLKKNKKPHRDRYTDPRRHYRGWNDTKGQYAGQTYHEPWNRGGGEINPGYWSNMNGRDKSGYELPNPAKLVGKMYSLDLDSAADTLENYYNKLNRLKQKIFDLDIRSVAGSGSFGSENYRSLLQYFGNAANRFYDLEHEVNAALKKAESGEWDEVAAARGMTREEMFNRSMDLNYYKRELDQYIKYIATSLKNLNN